MFSSETGNNSVEYLLTFPVSRSKILINKLIPRITTLFILFVFYIILLLSFGEDPFLIANSSFNAVYISVFIISLSFSPLRGNFLVGALSTFLLIILFIFGEVIILFFILTPFHSFAGFKISSFFIGSFDYFVSSFKIFLISFLLVLPFLISLFFAFQKYDVRSSKKYLKRFFKLLIPLFLTGLILSYFLIISNADFSYENYYMTKEGMIIRNDYVKNKTYIIDKNGEKEIYGFLPNRLNSYETEDSIYSHFYDRELNKKGIIIRFDKSTKKTEDFYIPDKKKYLFIRIYGYKNSLLLFEITGRDRFKKTEKETFVFLNIESLEKKSFELPKKSYRFFGVSESGTKRLWIGDYIDKGGLNCFTIDETGNYKNILKSDMHPLFINDKLISHNNGYLVIGEFSVNGYKELKKIKSDRPCFNDYYPVGADLNRKRYEYLYGIKRKDGIISSFIMVDLITLNIKEFKIDFAKRGKIFNIGFSDTLFEKYNDKGEFKPEAVYKFEGEKLQLLRKFNDFGNLKGTDFRKSSYGLIIGRGKAVKFFKYPDLKEIKFK